MPELGANVIVTGISCAALSVALSDVDVTGPVPQAFVFVPFVVSQMVAGVAVTVSVARWLAAVRP